MNGERVALPPDVLVPPGQEAFADAFLASKRLADGRIAWVVPMTFGKGRIVVQADLLSFCYDDAFCYDSRALAIAALEEWNGDGEPNGWMRHPTSGRRRPGGDASKEYVSL